MILFLTLELKKVNKVQTKPIIISIFETKFLYNYSFDIFHQIINWKFFSSGGLCNWEIIYFAPDRRMITSQKCQKCLKSSQV